MRQHRSASTIEMYSQIIYIFPVPVANNWDEQLKDLKAEILRKPKQHR